MRGGSVEQPYHATICVLVPSRQALLFGGVKHAGLEGRYRDFAFLACLRGVIEQRSLNFFTKRVDLGLEL